MIYEPVTGIDVFCWGRRVGALAPDPVSGLYAFEYYPDFLMSGIELSPLQLPLSTNRPVVFPQLSANTFHRLPAFVADALPDRFGNSLIDAWMAERGISRESITALDRLAYMGKRAMGALEFKPSVREDDVVPSVLEMRSLIEVARKTLSVNIVGEALVDQRENLDQLISVGSSAGGARAKAVVGWNRSTGDFVSGQFDLPTDYEHWIIKFDLDDGTGSPRQYGRVEYAYYLMARAAGIDMQESMLQEIAGVGHFMTKRFDRIGNEKIHTQTLCALSNLDFNLVGTFSSVQLFETAIELGLGLTALDALFDRLVFNVCMSNNDDHTKNWSFMLAEGGDWQLAPAYDLTYAHAKNNPWLAQHFLAVNGKYKDITRSDLLRLAERFSVSEPDARIDKMIDIAESWADFARKAGISADRIDEVGATINESSGLLK